MANFTKIFGLAGAAFVFAGLSFAQTTVTCSGPSASPGLIRAEGTTELVAEFSFSCTNTGVATTANILDILSLPVTSKIINTSTTATEAAIVNTGTLTVLAQGTISGQQINFSGVAIPAGVTNFAIVDVRVNASGLTVGTGTPPAVTESLFISGPAISTAVFSALPVGYALAGLGPVSLFKGAPPALTNLPTTGLSKGANSFVICSPIDKTHQGGGVGLISTIDFGENFATAFKGQGSGTNATLNSEFVNNTETGFVPPNGFPSVTAGVSNIAGSATTLMIVFSNVPANLSLYVPISITADQQTYAAGVASAPILGTLTLISASGAAVAASTSSSVVANVGAITASSGTATAYYVFTPGAGSSSMQESFAVPVYGVASANTITASSTAITAAVSFLASSTVPGFVVGPSTVSQTLSTFSGCTTSLLFPFITNQVGFDTGIAIANTSTDPFGTKGATPQAGTCSLNFYGAGAPSPNSLTTANVPSGTVYTGVLSGLAAGFQGYMIAQCNFQFAHGFAFITDGVGASGGLSQGYLAGVIPDVNQVSRAASPLSAAGANTGETLGN